MVNYNAKLQRSDVNGDPVDWTLVDDPENTDTALSDPVVDYGVRDALQNLPDYTGTWDYAAGSFGTQNVPAGGRVLSIVASAQGADASVAINGGDPIMVRDGKDMTINPEGQLIAPTVVFTGTVSYFIDWVI